MMDRALRILAAAAAIVVAAGIGVVAVALAIYAGALPFVGPAWAAAIVAAVMAAVAVGGVMAFRPPKSQRRDSEDLDASLLEKMIDLAREHPVLAMGAAVGAGIYAVRNPRLAAAIVAAFMAGRREPE